MSPGCEKRSISTKNRKTGKKPILEEVEKRYKITKKSDKKTPLIDRIILLEEYIKTIEKTLYADLYTFKSDINQRFFQFNLDFEECFSKASYYFDNYEKE